MKQGYHSNALTNLHIRSQIKDCSLTHLELVNRFNVSEATVSKWKNREILTDKSSRPNNIKYTISPMNSALCCCLRRSTATLR